MIILSWIGILSALIGNLMAAMQEDMKRLLAYSSVGQLGYILFGLSMMSNLGWLLAISGAIMHFLYKTMLFQAVGGVYSRTHDRMMYRMGGLIFRMPAVSSHFPEFRHFQDLPVNGYLLMQFFKNNITFREHWLFWPGLWLFSIFSGLSMHHFWDNLKITSVKLKKPHSGFYFHNTSLSCLS